MLEHRIDEVSRRVYSQVWERAVGKYMVYYKGSVKSSIDCDEWPGFWVWVSAINLMRAMEWWFRAKEMSKLEVTRGRQVEGKSQKGILKKATEDELKDICIWTSVYAEA